MPSFDSLVGLDKLETSANPGTGKTISQFQDSYRYFRSHGHTHTEARNLATDYHRRYTSREMTDNWDEMAQSVEDDSITSFDLISYNERVRRLVAVASHAEKRFLFAIIKFEGLDARLDEPNAALCALMCGSFAPDGMRSIAEWMGWTIRPNGSCNMVARYRHRLAQLALDTD